MSFYDLRKVNVLVVDDSGFMAKLLRTILRGLAVGRVEECTDPSRVFDCIQDFQPDAIFLDLEMPGVDGLEIARRLRKGDETPNPFLPLIMVTAHTKKANVLQARDAGVTEFLAKPVSAKSVYDRLAACIEAPRPFIKTPHYYGPDRRRHVDETFAGPERRKVRRKAGADQAAEPVAAESAA
jgi:two-component system, chemotaxis family, chemotaxis protein CheY